MSKRGRPEIDAWPPELLLQVELLKPRRPHPLNPDLDELAKYASGPGPWHEESDDHFIRQRLHGMDRKHLAGAYRKAHVELMRGPGGIAPSETTRDMVADALSVLWHDDMGGPRTRRVRVVMMSLDRERLVKQLPGMSEDERRDAKQKLAQGWGYQSFEAFCKALQPNRTKGR